MVYSLLILRRFRNDRWFNMIEEVKSSYRDRFVFIYIFNFPRTRNFKTEKSRLDRRLFLRGTRNEREITLIPLLSRLKYKHATRILAWLITSGQGSEGIKYFSPSKGSRPAFFFCPRAVSWPTKHSPPSQHRAFCFARLEHGPNVFVLSPFVPTFLPPSHPPFLLRSFLLLVLFLYTGSPSLPRFSRHFFPFRQREKSGRERERKAQESSRAVLSV